ncbi:MAG: 3'(2'),5'-bisphosphate nucleotidase CysQ [Rhizobiaceae bacterium]|nr:3'(2'),5'-bisphosphate nucleotidase CysQ [Rhizobiaceae bacterium]
MKKAAESEDARLQSLFEELAIAAGLRIMEVFHAGFSVNEKADCSPVTEADHAAEKIILAGLRREFPDIACVAEEECAAGHAVPALGRAFFLIDPLDGTKEFVNRHQDFTVNIALVRDGAPVVGVVFAPCSNRLFSGRPGHADAIDVSQGGQIAGRHRVTVRPVRSPLTVVASRSHSSPETEAFIRSVGAVELVSVGSSLKFCLLACGEADLYPRFTRTMEWDTAAGDAVLRAAGGMTRALDGAPLTYGKRNQPHDSDFANPGFIASTN